MKENLSIDIHRNSSRKLSSWNHARARLLDVIDSTYESKRFFSLLKTKGYNNRRLSGIAKSNIILTEVLRNIDHYLGEFYDSCYLEWSYLLDDHCGDLIINKEKTINFAGEKKAVFDYGISRNVYLSNHIICVYLLLERMTFSYPKGLVKKNLSVILHQYPGRLDGKTLENCLVQLELIDLIVDLGSHVAVRHVQTGELLE